MYVTRMLYSFVQKMLYLKSNHIVLFAFKLERGVARCNSYRTLRTPFKNILIYTFYHEHVYFIILNSFPYQLSKRFLITNF